MKKIILLMCMIVGCGVNSTVDDPTPAPWFGPETDASMPCGKTISPEFPLVPCPADSGGEVGSSVDQYSGGTKNQDGSIDGGFLGDIYSSDASNFDDGPILVPTPHCED